MEEPHMNGGGTEENLISTTNDNPEGTRVNGQSEVDAHLKTTVTVKKTEETIVNTISSQGNEKKTSYVIRSRTSVEESSTDEAEQNEAKPLKLVIRSRSIDETTAFEKSENAEKQANEGATHDDMSAEITAQAREIVKTVLEKIETDEGDKDYIEETLYTDELKDDDQRLVMHSIVDDKSSQEEIQTEVTVVEEGDTQQAVDDKEVSSKITIEENHSESVLENVSQKHENDKTSGEQSVSQSTDSKFVYISDEKSEQYNQNDSKEHNLSKEIKRDNAEENEMDDELSSQNETREEEIEEDAETPKEQHEEESQTVVMTDSPPSDQLNSQNETEEEEIKEDAETSKDQHEEESQIVVMTDSPPSDQLNSQNETEEEEIKEDAETSKDQHEEESQIVVMTDSPPSDQLSSQNETKEEEIKVDTETPKEQHEEESQIIVMNDSSSSDELSSQKEAKEEEIKEDAEKPKEQHKDEVKEEAETPKDHDNGESSLVVISSTEVEISELVEKSKEEKSDDNYLVFTERAKVKSDEKTELKQEEKLECLQDQKDNNVQPLVTNEKTDDDISSMDMASIAVEEEEPGSPKHEYVAESFRQESQSLPEIQEGNDPSDNKPQEKPVVKVLIPEEPLTTDNQTDSNIINVDNQVLESSDIKLEALDNESDSEGEVDVTVERLSQENEQLIKEGEDESAADDWMAKDDADEFLFKGKDTIVSAEEEKETVENKQSSIDEAVVADVKAATVFSNISELFSPGEEASAPQEVITENAPSVQEVDIDKEIEEEIERQRDKNKVVTNSSSQKVMEEILPNQQKKKDNTDLNILLVDDKEDANETEEDKPPSPVEAKKVTEEGLTEIFETEVLRRSGIFDDTLVEEDEEHQPQQLSKIPEKDIVLANEEHLEAQARGKHASLRWSLLEKWEEMTNKPSVEMEQSDPKEVDLTETVNDEEQEGQQNVTETYTSEMTQSKEGPSSITTVKTTTTIFSTTEFAKQTVSEIDDAIPQNSQQHALEINEIGHGDIETIVHDENKINNNEKLQETPSDDPKDDELCMEPLTPANQSVTDDKSIETPVIPASGEEQPQIDNVDDDTAKLPLISNAQDAQQDTNDRPLSTDTAEFISSGPEYQTLINEDDDNPKLPLMTKDKDVTTESTKTEQMSTILFKMDGTPFVIPANPPKSLPKSVNFSSDDSVRPLSITSVESIRGEKEGTPPLAGGEESDIDDSTQLILKPHQVSSRVPQVSPVKEAPSIEIPDTEKTAHEPSKKEPLSNVDHDEEDVDLGEDEIAPLSPGTHDLDEKKEDADAPLLDQTQPDADKGQKCCIIV